MFRGIAFGLLVEHLYCMYGYVLIAVEENATGYLTLTLNLTPTGLDPQKH